MLARRTITIRRRHSHPHFLRFSVICEITQIKTHFRKYCRVRRTNQLVHVSPRILKNVGRHCTRPQINRSAFKSPTCLKSAFVIYCKRKTSSNANKLKSSILLCSLTKYIYKELWSTVKSNNKSNAGAPLLLQGNVVITGHFEKANPFNSSATMTAVWRSSIWQSSVTRRHPASTQISNA